jgi:hypothetical protein
MFEVILTLKSNMAAIHDPVKLMEIKKCDILHCI